MTSTRLNRELEEMAKNPPSMCSAGPVKGTLNEWKAQIQGPEGSPYQGGTFKMQIIFPDTFPQSPPYVKMLTKVYHPNITEAGSICLDILKDKWTSQINVGRMLLAICALLAKPNPLDPLDMAKATMYQTNRGEYNRIAKYWTQLYAK